MNVFLISSFHIITGNMMLVNTMPSEKSLYNIFISTNLHINLRICIICNKGISHSNRRILVSNGLEYLHNLILRNVAAPGLSLVITDHTDSYGIM